MALNSREQWQNASKKILFHLEKKYSTEDRQDFIKRICKKLNVDWKRLQTNRMFRLAPPKMIKEYSQISGIEMELHTHRHVFPDSSYEECLAEIQENQAFLFKWTGKKSWHFCYPSGWYDKKQITWLQNIGVKSATTVQPALNECGKNLWELDRFLDGENISDIEFKAELCGISDFLRNIARR